MAAILANRYDVTPDEDEESDTLMAPPGPGSPRHRYVAHFCSRLCCGESRTQRRVYAGIYAFGTIVLVGSFAIGASLVLPVAITITLMLGLAVNCLRLSSEYCASELMPRLMRSRRRSGGNNRAASAASGSSSSSSSSRRSNARRHRPLRRLELDNPVIRARLQQAGLTDAGIAQLGLMLEDRDFDGDDYTTLLALDDDVNNSMQSASIGEISRLPTFKWRKRNSPGESSNSDGSSGGAKGSGTSSAADAAPRPTVAVAEPVKKATTGTEDSSAVVNVADAPSKTSTDAATGASAAAAASASPSPSPSPSASPAASAEVYGVPEKATASAHPNNLDRCDICLEPYVDAELLRILPCLHSFHVGCIDTWLGPYKRTCPLCKAEISDPVFDLV
jgi:hypothetical protein